MTPMKSRNPNLTTSVGSNNTQHDQRVKSRFSPSISWSEDIYPPPETTALSFREQRVAYFRMHYDLMTGLRIAGTLGGFFLLVLLTLLYKSKCKKSPLPTPTISMERIGHGNIQSFPHDNTPIHHDTRLLLEMDGEPPWNRPAFLLTSPNDQSESSTESDTRSIDQPINRLKNKRNFLQQPIDIHIIQPTPSISPSNSQRFAIANQSYPPDEPNPKRGRYTVTNPRASDSDASPLLHFLQAENWKYVDDTSSENLPAPGSDDDVESPSIGSDSVFTFHQERRKSSYDWRTGGETLDDDEENCGITLSEATAQVHHRDSFCSAELEADYLENRRRRSSSTQTTLSDLRQGEQTKIIIPSRTELSIPGQSSSSDFGVRTGNLKT